MRHQKHKHVLGVKTAHRSALMANLVTALFKHGRIKTTLAKAKALRPFSEKLITLACKAEAADDPAKKLHYRRQAIARVRDVDAVKQLFDERVGEFVNRTGGYTRIYKLVPRLGDGADMAIIELIEASDEGYNKKPKKKAKKKSDKKVAPKAEETEVEAPTEVTPAAEAAPVAEATEVPKAEAAPAEKPEATDEDKK